MKKIRIRLFQISLSGDINKNLEKLSRAVSIPFKPEKSGRPLPKRESSRIIKNNFDLLVLPELFTTGYHGKTKMKSLAEDFNGPTLSTIKKLAKQYGIAFAAGSFIEKEKETQYNTSVTVDRNGNIISKYRKTHLFTVLDEDKLLSPGDDIDIFRLERLTAGTFMCFELRFPEIPRKLALLGAEILFCPVEWSHPKSEILFTLARARAIENQVFLALANIVGKSGGLDFCGGSMVVAPDGRVIAKGSDDTEEIIDAVIDIDEVKNYRKEIPALSLRREELYRRKK